MALPPLGAVNLSLSTTIPGRRNTGSWKAPRLLLGDERGIPAEMGQGQLKGWRIPGGCSLRICCGSLGVVIPEPGNTERYALKREGDQAP